MGIIILVQAFYLFFKVPQEKQEIRTELASTEQELASTMQRMNEIKAELDEKIAEVQNSVVMFPIFKKQKKRWKLSSNETSALPEKRSKP